MIVNKGSVENLATLTVVIIKHGKCVNFINLVITAKTIGEISFFNSGIFIEFKSLDGLEKTELFSEDVFIELAG